MDTALKNAEARRAQAKRELEEAQGRVKAILAELDRIDRFLQDWREFAGVSNAQVDAAQDAESGEGSKPRPKNPPRDQVGDIVEKIIRGRGHPVSRNDLFVGLQEEGIELEGTDPRMVLSTMLWRMPDRFIRLKPLGYWVKDTNYENREKGITYRVHSLFD